MYSWFVKSSSMEITVTNTQLQRFKQIYRCYYNITSTYCLFEIELTLTYIVSVKTKIKLQRLD